MSEPMTIADWIKLLHDEAKHYDIQARTYLNKVEQLVTLAVAIAAIATPLLLGAGRYVVGLLIPVAACFILLLTANATGEMLALFAHRFRVEERLVAIIHDAQKGLDTPTVVFTPWEMSGGQARRYSKVYVVIQASGLLFVGAMVPGFAIFLWQVIPTMRWAVIASTSASAVMFGLSVAAFFEALTMFGKTYKNMLKHEGQDLKPPVGNLNGLPNEPAEGRATTSAAALTDKSTGGDLL